MNLLQKKERKKERKKLISLKNNNKRVGTILSIVNLILT